METAMMRLIYQYSLQVAKADGDKDHAPDILLSFHSGMVQITFAWKEIVMLGELTDQQIDFVLHTQVIGRIGCQTKDKLYVVPITYAFDGECIYAFTKEGLKINAMRQNPEVCFEVDIIENMANWRSVIVWGKYRELTDEAERKAGLKLLMDKITPMRTSETVKPKPQRMAPQIVERERKPIVIEIRLKEKTGRYEKD